MKLAIYLAEHRILNDRLIRWGILKLLEERKRSIQNAAMPAMEWVRACADRPIAESTEDANAQHYEIPAAYFHRVLGPHLKYSSGIWPEGCDSLAESEAAMLELSCQRAELADGQDILELGCGWGSLSLWMAERYPNSRITSVSNSKSQREYIEAQAMQRRLTNLTVRTQDINRFQAAAASYDRVVSVEMMEHLRNHQLLFQRLHNWLRPAGKIFIHIFAHREQTYLFDAHSSKDWMSKYFFTGGIMPAVDLLPTAAQPHFSEEASWPVNGVHYSKTLEAWLKKHDAAAPEVLKILETCYGSEAKLWLQRWRMFYMACSELFAYNGGTEWFVMHYRLTKTT
jgi:cyclopropane-fatty-acyl-phospholipid synthase